MVWADCQINGLRGEVYERRLTRAVKFVEGIKKGQRENLVLARHATISYREVSGHIMQVWEEAKV